MKKATILVLLLLAPLSKVSAVYLSRVEINEFVGAYQSFLNTTEEEAGRQVKKIISTIVSYHGHEDLEVLKSTVSNFLKFVKGAKGEKKSLEKLLEPFKVFDPSRVSPLFVLDFSNLFTETYLFQYLFDLDDVTIDKLTRVFKRAMTLRKSALDRLYEALFSDPLHYAPSLSPKASIIYNELPRNIADLAHNIYTELYGYDDFINSPWVFKLFPPQLVIPYHMGCSSLWHRL